MSDSVQPHRQQSTRLPRPWGSPGKNTGVGCHFLFQGIFLTQGLNLVSPELAGGFFSTEPPGKTEIEFFNPVVTLLTLAVRENASVFILSNQGICKGFSVAFSNFQEIKCFLNSRN